MTVEILAAAPWWVWVVHLLLYPVYQVLGTLKHEAAHALAAMKAQYEAVRKDLQAMGLLKKNNSLTTDGKNVTDQWTDEYALLRAYGIDPVEYRKKTRGW